MPWAFVEEAAALAEAEGFACTGVEPSGPAVAGGAMLAGAKHLVALSRRRDPNYRVKRCLDAARVGVSQSTDAPGAVSFPRPAAQVTRLATPCAAL